MLIFGCYSLCHDQFGVIYIRLKHERLEKFKPGSRGFETCGKTSVRLVYRGYGGGLLDSNEWAFHDDVIKFSALLALFDGSPPVTGGFHSQRTVTRSFL